jgi:putative heme-binding domain-containing protein
VPHSSAAAGLVRKIIHRLLDTKDAARLGVAVDFINRLDDAHAELAMAAIQGVLDAEMSKAMVAKGVASLDLAKLQGSANAPLAAIASRLAAKWGNAAAAAKSLALIVDPKSTNDERIQAIRLAREFDSDAARATLGDVIAGKFEPPVKLEAIRALGQIGTDASSDAVIGAWASLNPDTRRAAAEVLTGRLTWIKSLLKAIDDKRIAAGDISALAIRTISQQKDEGVQVMFRKTIGRYRPSDADKLALIALKKKIMTDGSKIDYEAGHQLAQKTCLVCHSFYGEGMHVGPDLTGVGRSSIDALLHNVIDPNEIIGAGYENTIVETKDHRNVAGRLVESTDDHVKLLSAGDKEDVVPKGNIESIRTEKISVMPEGLVDTMPDADLRNLLWYIFSPPQEHGAKSH